MSHSRGPDALRFWSLGWSLPGLELQLESGLWRQGTPASSHVKRRPCTGTGDLTVARPCAIHEMLFHSFPSRFLFDVEISQQSCGESMSRNHAGLLTNSIFFFTSFFFCRHECTIFVESRVGSAKTCDMFTTRICREYFRNALVKVKGASARFISSPRFSAL